MHLGVFVEARREPHRIGQLQAAEFGRQDGIVGPVLARSPARLQRLDAEIMRRLGVQPPQQRHPDRVDQAHAAPGSGTGVTVTARAVGIAP